MPRVLPTRLHSRSVANSATLALTLIACLLAGCDKRKGELTRPLAAELINEQLASVSELSFNSDSDGAGRALRDGIIQEDQYGMQGDRFTEKGFKMVSSVIAQNHIYHPAWVSANFRLKSPIAERVRDITGISAIPGTGVSSVEYVTDYLIPTELQPMAQYLYTGSKAKATFRKYDDGWRVESNRLDPF